MAGRTVLTEGLTKTDSRDAHRRATRIVCIRRLHSRPNLLFCVQTCATVARSGLYDCHFNRRLENALDLIAECHVSIG